MKVDEQGNAVGDITCNIRANLGSAAAGEAGGAELHNLVSSSAC